MAAIAENDCEVIGTGFFGQPVNSLSSAAFVVAGLWLVWYASRRARLTWPLALVGGAMVAAGIGSIAFHGPMGPWAQFLHDAGLAAIPVSFLAIGVSSLQNSRRGSAIWILIPSAIAVIAALVIWPGASNAVTITAITAVVVTQGLQWRADPRPLDRSGRMWFVVAGVVSMAAIPFQVLGRTGGLLCDPSSVLQSHALWHVLSAVATTIFALAVHQRFDTDTRLMDRETDAEPAVLTAD